MEKIVWNKCQTPLSELSCIVDNEEVHFKDCPREVQENFWDFLNNVPFIRWLVSPDRPLVSQLPRDGQGRATIDVTKPPILENSDFFRQTALTWINNNHRYTNLRPNINPNSEFGKWFNEEKRRGWEGLVDSDTGMWVTGDYYWMLNYCPMHLVQKRPDGMEIRTVAHPKLWDGQFFNSHYVYQARLNKKHAAMLASRGKGKTSFGAAALAKRFIIGEFADNYEEIQSFVTASDKGKLTDPNQILQVFVDNINFCAKNTQFAASRLKSSWKDLEWKMGYKKSGSDVEYGSRNTVAGVLTGVNQDKLNGSRGVLYLIEEAGIFKNLSAMYNLIRPSVEQGTSVFGEIYLYGTAGDDQSDFTTFAEMYYSPDGYKIYKLENVFDKEGQGRKTIGNFYPVYLNYDDTCIDKDGNSDVTKALLAICMDRYTVKYGSTDINTITKRISQYPITPQEAIIRSQGNMFPVTELNNRLNQIDNNPDAYSDVWVGELVQVSSAGEAADTVAGQYVNNGVMFQPTGGVPIRDFPTKDNKVEGCLEIYEHPQKGSDGKVPYDRYGAGCDPFDDDESGTMSLGSFFIMDFWTDRIVLEYTGRPMFAGSFYETVRLACLYYNCKCLYENNLKGIFSYFSIRNCIHLLADTPDYLKDRQLVSTIGYGNKAKGVRATTPIIKAGFKMIRDWLLKPVTRIEKDAEGNEAEVTVPNLYHIRSRALLKELIQWNQYGNFDRIMSLVQLMLYREEKMILYQGDVKKAEHKPSGIETDEYWSRNYPGRKNR